VTGSLNWSSGMLQGSGILVIGPEVTATLNAMGSGLSLVGRRVLNHGTANWTSPGALSFSAGAIWDNQGGSSFHAQTGFSFQIVTGPGSFLNAGTFVKSGSGTAVIDALLTFSNSGTVDIQGGTLELHAGSSGGTIIVASGALLRLFGYALTSTSDITGSGSVDFAGGTSTLAGTISASGGVTIAAGVTVSTAGSATLNTNLTNNGTLILAGLGVAGTLTINGNYTQSSGATLRMEIGGTTAGSGYDRLTISGTATLAGTLDVSYIGGFTPSSGDVFTLITFGSRIGTFGTIIDPWFLTAQYNAGDFRLLA
jgi:hypothetical protein